MIKNELLLWWQGFYTENGALINSILLALIMILLLRWLYRFLTRKLYNDKIENKNWYRLRVALKWVMNGAIALIILLLLSQRVTDFYTFLGIFGAGVTFALREVILCFAGWLGNLFGDFLKTGDRIEISGIKGDVIDTGVLRTTVMETGGWLKGDQYDGRIVRIPNSFFYTSPLYVSNDSGFNYVWDEINVVVSYDSDHSLVRSVLDEVVKSHVGDSIAQAAREWVNMRRKYLIDNTPLEPKVYLDFTDTGVRYYVRYSVKYNGKRALKTKLYEDILQRFLENKNVISFASSLIEIKTVDSDSALE